jgi:hypothetical protein
MATIRWEVDETGVVETDCSGVAVFIRFDSSFKLFMDSPVKEQANFFDDSSRIS